MSTDAPTKIWLFRKGNGQVRVHPSPVVLNQDKPFRIRNVSAVAATATFPAGTIAENEPVCIRGGETSPALLVTAPAGYFEYTVVLESGEYAEGGSKPGGIVDP